MSRLAAEVDSLERLCRAALALLHEYGWQTFGSFDALSPEQKLEFSEQLDRDGVSYFERVAA